jgi:hypothetical protein
MAGSNEMPGRPSPEGVPLAQSHHGRALIGALTKESLNRVTAAGKKPPESSATGRLARIGCQDWLPHS